METFLRREKSIYSSTHGLSTRNHLGSSQPACHTPANKRQLVDTNASPLKRRALTPVGWTQEVEPHPQLRFGEAEAVLRIPVRYLVGSGIKSPRRDSDLLLYRLAAMEDQWSEMQRGMVDTFTRLYIYESQGTGKSCAAYAFACGMVDRSQWDVLWIHLSWETQSIHCVKFQGDIKSTRAFHPKAFSTQAELTELEDLLRVSSDSKSTIAFFDGFHQRDAEGYSCLRSWLSLWHCDEPTRRRLVEVTSMAFLEKQFKRWVREESTASTMPQALGQRAPSTATSRSMKIRIAVNTFRVVSWELEEYLSAVAHDEFFRHIQHIQHNLLPTPSNRADIPHYTRSQLKQRITLAEHKYFVAGGNAQLMFAMTTSDCIDFLGEIEDTVRDFEHPRFGCVGPHAHRGVECLLALYNPTYERLASGYVAIRSHSAWNLNACENR